MAAPEDTKPPAKPNPAAAAKKKPLDDDEEEDVKPGGPALKQKMLSTGLSRAVVIAAVLATLGLLIGNIYGGRYELVPAPNSANGFMYRIDTLTGAVHFCAPAQCTSIPVRSGNSAN